MAKKIVFNSEDRNHLEKANFELGELCSRVGKLEGTITTEFKNIGNKLDGLPCSDYGQRIATIEGENIMSGKIKMVIVGAVCSIITFVVTSLL